jgi:penicillin-binding protein 3
MNRKFWPNIWSNLHERVPASGGQIAALARLALILSMAASLLLLGSCALLPATASSGTAASTAAQSDTATTAGETADPLPTVIAYTQAWIKADYAGMYRLLAAPAQSRIGEAAFVERYTNIMKGIEAGNLICTYDSAAIEVAPDGQSAQMAFAISMDTLAGSAKISGYTLTMLLETRNGRPVWTVDWTEKLIFPHMEATDKVRARVIDPQRGQIYDRNGVGLAINGELTTIGVVPGKFDAVKAEAIPQMAALLGISTTRIEKALASATNPDWFYPVVTLPADSGDLSAQLTAIAGVQFQKVQGRIYPVGAATGLVIGYIGPITAEELKKHPDEGYSLVSKIGKMGLEQVYEARLRGKAGGEVYLAAADSGAVKERIAYEDPVDGEDITLTLDSKIQYNIYSQMKGDAGGAAAINPQTGEILALVSTPSFDPNLLQSYIPDAVQTSWNEAVKSPFSNRFKVGYAPGSVFKLVTAAIGLKAGTLDPAEALPITGLQWQPDRSWGNYKITRVHDLGRPVDMLNAFIYSDNIYFAQQALRVGAAGFAAGAAGFGIGEPLPIDYPFAKSQIANKDLSNPVLLADSGYGQGEVLVSPLHIALFYSALATNGDVLTPVLELSGITQAVQPQIWKAQAIAADHVPPLTNALLQVVENPAGTGYTRKAYQTRIIGKTGTAELKASQTDTTAEENGWFVAMNVDNPRLTIAMMIEDVKERGASHYVVPLVKQAMDDVMAYLNR